MPVDDEGHYVPSEVYACCSGYFYPSDGHDVSPPCATTLERRDFQSWLERHDREVRESQEAVFHFSDAEWREYQSMPEQGYSHRGKLEFFVNRWLQGMSGRDGA